MGGRGQSIVTSRLWAVPAARAEIRGRSQAGSKPDCESELKTPCATFFFLLSFSKGESNRTSRAPVYVYNVFNIC